MLVFPDMQCYDYGISGQRKITLQGCMFHLDEEEQEAVTEWVNSVGGKVWFHNLIHWCNKCVNHLGNYAIILAEFAKHFPN